MTKVLGISASPRAGGNSDLLLREALAGAEEAGARTAYLALRELEIGPCTECEACYSTGYCPVQDDFPAVLRSMLDTDRLIFATPIFFMGVAAQAKALIDRCQCMWATKYLLGRDVVDEAARSRRRGMVIAVGGTRGRKMFYCVHATMKYFFDAIEMAHAAELFVNRVDAKGDVLRHPTAMARARELGRLIAGDDPIEPMPLTIELFDMMPEDHSETG